MKKKLAYLFLITIVILSVIFTQKNPNRKRETYVDLVSKKNFLKKLRNSPSWMDEQIEKDLEFAKSKKVDQEALKATLTVMKQKFSDNKSHFIRYRILDNKLYQLFLEDEKYSKKEDAFERALKTVLRLKKLSDMDFILSNIDGIPDPNNTEISTSYFEKARGFYLTEDTKKQAPIFTRAKSNKVKEAILVPDYFAVSELWQKMQKEVLTISKQSSWEKKENVLHWRGASSKTPRFNLCKSSLSNDLIDAAFAEKVDDRKIQELKKWNQLSGYDSLKKSYATLEEQVNYKYLPVLDGVMCTYPGYQWRLLSNSVAFKQESDEMQWFYNALKPYVHFVPLKNDLSDTLEKVTWAVENDEKCKQIAQNATDFALQNLTTEDVYVYLYKVLKEYSKHQNFNRKDLLEDIKKDPRWISISNRRKANKIIFKDR